MTRNLHFIRLAGIAGFRRRCGAAAAVAGIVVMAAWFIAVTRFPGPREADLAILTRLAMLCGLSTTFAQMHGMLTLRSRHASLVIFTGALCFGLSAWCLLREPSPGVAVRLSLPLLAAAMMWHYVFVVSVFRGKYRVSRLRVGDRFPDFRLADTRNRAMRLASTLNGMPALLVFYKGDW